ncbi:MAG: DNA primase [Gammaproteobacteria bacterium]
MAGKIPSTFIDSLMARVDIVDVVDRRVPLVRKGKEFQACCPFHEEKTPSFTVSPSKQFYHCFGCGAHGTAIGFLMDYANLGFVEAVEELAEGVGLEVPRENTAGQSAQPKESPGQLLGIVEEASGWFQQQLRIHGDAKNAIAYLKRRGLDGRTCATFGVGFAPDSWDGLLSALGKNDVRKQQLMKAGLVTRRDNKESKSGREFYDRFRGRIIFPIEDHRGRVVAFGGRILGDGEPKYLNSPETSLFHKGAELYGLHRARREIGAENRSIVVEGYMDVISLAQFGVDNAVATLGTATSRTHLQRLFRLAPEIVFCFDGDRAGRDAAWKAMQVALPEMQDGRQLGFLFLPDGEDPDTIVRQEGGEAFQARVGEAMSLDRFLFDTLVTQVDMGRMEGKARLVSMAKPLINQMPAGALQQMMLDRLSSLTGLSGEQMGKPHSENTAPRQRLKSQPLEAGQLSPMALAISLLLQNPELGRKIDDPQLVQKLEIEGAQHLRQMLALVGQDESINTARLLEHFRESGVHNYLEKLASYPTSIHSEALHRQFNDTLVKLLAQQDEQRRLHLLEKSRGQGLEGEEKQELLALLDAKKQRIDQVSQ